MDINYYPINETTAKTANNINSFNDYEPGSATKNYKEHINALYEIVELIRINKPRNYDKALYMADRYNKKYADYLNAYYRNEAKCPSVLVCGAGNFPVSKKNKQNARRDSLMVEYNNLREYSHRISNLLQFDAPIKSSDADAIERLQDKLADLEAEQKKMKAINSYYRKNKTCVGCDYLDDEKAQKIDEALLSDNCWYDVPYPPFKLQNNNATIRNTKARLEKLKAVKEQGTQETENEFFKVIENTELMRLQLVFEGKPDETTRNILKSNGFKWAPSQQAWQRQLTDASKYALKRVLNELQAV